MNIRKYEAFVRAVERGSLSKAAEELGYTQSGISHMMQALEEEIGFPLMVRTSAGIKPNSEGQMLLPAIRELLSANETLEQYIAKIKGVDAGHITIACYASIAAYWLPAIIAGFRKDYPNVEVEIIEAGARRIEQLMEERQADLCIYAGGEGKNFEWLPLRSDRMLVLVPPDHPLTAQVRVTPRMLEKEKFTFDQPCDGCVSYTLYAIVNYDGIIMAEFIRNSSIARGDYTHEIGTKVLESPAAMIQAMRKYYVGEGVSEIHPEYSRDKTEVVV